MSCDKFEELFIKESPNELLIHIQSCETCMYEYKKMLKTEKIIKEVKPHFSKKKQPVAFAAVAACFALVAVSSSVIFQNNFHNPVVTKISYEDAVSGDTPVDEYGLVDIQ